MMTILSVNPVQGAGKRRSG